MVAVARHAQSSSAAVALPAARPRSVCSRHSIAVRAAATGPGSRKPKNMTQQVQQQCEAFFQHPMERHLRDLRKYDVLSCGMGALACTSFFVYNGQDPGTALSITLMATISGLVLNELLFENADARW